MPSKRSLTVAPQCRATLSGHALKQKRRHGSNTSHRAGAFTIAEAVISMVLVSVLLVAALNTLGASKLSQKQMMDHGDAHLLAADLLSEIMRQSYADPEDVKKVDLRKTVKIHPLGLDSGESGGSRIDFDDVDDYQNWTSTLFSGMPERKDSTLITEFVGWNRSVTVERMSAVDPTLTSASEQGLKRITVTVSDGGVQAIHLVGFKGAGLPPAPTGIQVLLVVADPAVPTALETARQTLMESWGFTVTLIDDAATQVDFDAAVAITDVAYICETASSIQLNTKLTNATIGVVNEEALMIARLELADTTLFYIYKTEADITDNTHYISSTLTLGKLTLVTSQQPFVYAAGSVPADALLLAKVNKKKSMLVADTGAVLLNGFIAPGRRVQLPWGYIGFDITSLTAEGQTLMKRAIEWAASMEQP